MFDVTVMGEELTKKVEGTVDEIKFFLESIDHNLIAYSSNIPKSNAEMTDAEKTRLPLLLQEIKETQDTIKSLYPDQEKIAELSKKINELSIQAATLAATLASLQVQLVDAIQRGDADKQKELNPQISACMNQINSVNVEMVNNRNALSAEVLKIPDPQTLVKYMAQLGNLNQEYRQIVYYRPGAVPRALDSVDEILERFNEVDQPRIELILDQVPAAVKDVDSVLKRFNVEEQPRIEKILDEVPGTIASAHDVIARVNAVEQPKVEDILDSVDDTIDDADLVLKQVYEQFVTVSLEPIDPAHLGPDLKGKLDDLLKEHDTAVLRLQERQKIVGTVKGAIRDGPAITPLPGPATNPPGSQAASLPGVAARAIGGTYDNQYAYQKQLEREKLKIGKEIDRIRFRRVEKPGRVPLILDSARGSLEETHGLIGKINGATGKVLDFAGKYSLFLKIGAGITGLCIVLTAVLVPLLVIRMILFGL